MLLEVKVERLKATITRMAVIVLNLADHMDDTNLIYLSASFSL